MWFIKQKVLKPTIYKEKITHAEKYPIIGRKAYYLHTGAGTYIESSFETNVLSYTRFSIKYKNKNKSVFFKGTKYANVVISEVLFCL